MWFQLSGGLALKKAASLSYYHSLTKLGKEPKLCGISSTDADMFRTFRWAPATVNNFVVRLLPDIVRRWTAWQLCLPSFSLCMCFCLHTSFRSSAPIIAILCCRSHVTLNSFQAIAAVRRIALGYGRRNPEAPFTKNVHYVAAFLLAVFGLDREEDVFWTLTALLEQRLHPSCVLEVSIPAGRSAFALHIHAIFAPRTLWGAAMLHMCCTHTAMCYSSTICVCHSSCGCAAGWTRLQRGAARVRDLGGAQIPPPAGGL